MVVMDKVRELSPPQFDLANEVPPSPFHEDLQFLHISLKTVRVQLVACVLLASYQVFAGLE